MEQRAKLTTPSGRTPSPQDVCFDKAIQKLEISFDSRMKRIIPTFPSLEEFNLWVNLSNFAIHVPTDHVNVSENGKNYRSYSSLDGFKLMPISKIVSVVRC